MTTMTATDPLAPLTLDERRLLRQQGFENNSEWDKLAFTRRAYGGGNQAGSSGLARHNNGTWEVRWRTGDREIEMRTVGTLRAAIVLLQLEGVLP